MYEAKTNGKARYAVFNGEISRRAIERLQTEEELRGAIDRGELCLHYQPIMELGTGRLREVEALVRWEHPARGMVSPARFVPIAEESGLIVPVGRWVLREACRQAKEWQERFPSVAPHVMNVNLSAHQLKHSALVAEVAEILRETRLEPSSLCLEITETAMIENSGSSQNVIEQLRQLGVRLAIDDFGTGYSSMAYLQSFPIDTLKIDRSFVVRLGAREEDGAIVGAIVTLARTLKLEVVGEGIETPHQAAMLHQLGCALG
ncbi:MAG: hypothetical protein C4321_09545, partial [Chloroflexota bacterium]